MTIESRHVAPASMQGMSQAIGFVEAFCGRHRIAKDDTLRLTLLVEELFTNTVVHGFGGDGSAPVRIALRAAAGQIELWYEDIAPPFDPRSRAEPDDDRAVGGLGIPLVMKMASRVSYLREDGANRLHLVLTRKRLAKARAARPTRRRAP